MGVLGDFWRTRGQHQIFPLETERSKIHGILTRLALRHYWWTLNLQENANTCQEICLDLKVSPVVIAKIIFSIFQ